MYELIENDWLDMGELPEEDFGIVSKEDWLSWYYSEDNRISENENRVPKLDAELLIDLDLMYMGIPTCFYDGETLQLKELNINSLESIHTGISKLTETKIVFLHNVTFQPKQVITHRIRRKDVETVLESFYRIQFATLDIE